MGQVSQWAPHRKNRMGIARQVCLALMVVLVSWLMLADGAVLGGGKMAIAKQVQRPTFFRTSDSDVPSSFLLYIQAGCASKALHPLNISACETFRENLQLSVKVVYPFLLK